MALNDPEQTQYGFDAAGNFTTVTQLAGATVVLTSTLGYDELGRLTSRVNADGSGSTLSSFTYMRRIDGQITGFTEIVQQPDSSSITTTASYTYDALNRLVREEVNTAGTADDYTTDYTLDLVGNRLTRLTVWGSGVVERAEGAFDARDRLTEEKVYDAATGGSLTNTISYGYDANGSLTGRTETAGPSLTQDWDVRGRLSGATADDGAGTVTTATYRYDPNGIRRWMREAVNGGAPTTTLYLIDSLSPSGYAQAVEERTESGLVLASYVYGRGLDPISVMRPGQPVGLYLADGHSGVRQVVDLATFAILAAYRYDAFGKRLAETGTFINPIGYRGERFDATLGQYNLRARLYDPRAGRFTAVDPFEGMLADPMSLHRYLYGYSDGVNKLDPTGMLAVGGFSGQLSIIIARFGRMVPYKSGNPSRS